MKKLVFAVAAMSTFVFACGKDDKDEEIDPNAKYCWTCTITASAAGITTPATTEDYCDKTSAEIKEVEKEGTFSNTEGGVTSSLKTTCKKK